MAAEQDPEARERLLEELARGSSVAAAARAAGYSRMHAHRLLKEPAFAGDLERRRAERAHEEVSADEQLALEVLRAVCVSKKAKAFDRVAAAKALLAHCAPRRLASRAPEPAPPPPIVLEGGGDDAARSWLDQAGDGA